MRFVAAFLALLLAAAVLPTVAAVNECTGTCQTVATPNAPPATGPKTYYLYAASVVCNPPAAGQCAGQPAPLLFGVVYEESGCFPGLQRYPGFFNGVYCPADSVVLL